VLAMDSENTMNKLGKDGEAGFGKAMPCICHGAQIVTNPLSKCEATAPMTKHEASAQVH
jgi:hypothetical protein